MWNFFNFLALYMQTLARYSDTLVSVQSSLAFILYVGSLGAIARRLVFAWLFRAMYVLKKMRVGQRLVTMGGPHHVSISRYI